MNETDLKEQLAAEEAARKAAEEAAKQQDYISGIDYIF